MRWMCSVKLTNRLPLELMERLSLEDNVVVLQCNRLHSTVRCYGRMIKTG